MLELNHPINLDGYMTVEASHSGLLHTPGKRESERASWVRTPPLPLNTIPAKRRELY